MYFIYLLFIIRAFNLTSGGIVVPPIEGELDWWQNAVIYEIFPLSFKDSNGDGSGDFNGITEKLDYLVDIGVNAIWLTPFLKSPLESGGYDITDYQKVQDVFGSMEDLEELINTAHKKNIKVLMDFVPNHTSDKHIWFQKSIKNTDDTTDYYIWKDAKNQDQVMKNSSVKPIEPNNWLTAFSDSAWFWHETRQQFYYSQFIKNLPDLNFRNQKVHEEMKTILKYWIKKGIDGIRIDALKHVYESEKLENEPVINPNASLNYYNFRHWFTADQDEVYDLIREWHQLLAEFKGIDNETRIIMTESYSSNEVLFKYYLNGAEIPTNFNLMLYNTSTQKVYITPKQYDNRIRRWITEMPETATYNVVLQNHDGIRIGTLYGIELIDWMNALSLFLPGVAIVYYGGEIGMEDIPHETNFARSPMQWSNTKYAGFTDSDEPWIEVHSNYKTKNVETEYNDPKSHLNFFKSVSSLRQTDTLKRGGLATYVFDQVYVLTRFLPGNENYTLIINMDANSQTINLSDQIPRLFGSLTVIIASENSKLDPGNTISTESLTLKPRAAIIVTDKYATVQSSGTQMYFTLEVLILCLCIIKSCNL